MVMYYFFLQANPEDQTAKDLAMVMFETATLRSGFSVADSAGFAERIERMLRLSMDVSLDAKVSYFMFIYRKLLRSVCIAENLNRFLNSLFLIKVM